MPDSDARASLARIEANLGHVAKQGDETRKVVDQVRQDVQGMAVAGASNHERLVANLWAVDQRVENHEAEDERRFSAVHDRLNAILPADSGARRAAKGGGLLVVGGGSVLAVLEILKLINSSGG